MELNNKTLLLMGGGAYAKGIKKYKDESGFRVVAVGRDADTPISKLADVFYQVDTHDISAVCEIVEKEKCDGIFVGASESNILAAIEVAKNSSARFYVTAEQWDLIADKISFKSYCRMYGVPVIPEYKISQNPSAEEIASLHYPVLLKPTDSCSAKGINACYQPDDFLMFYNEALKFSEKKKIIVEDLIEGAEEFFVHYTIQDGVFSLSCAFTKFRVNVEGKYVTLPLFHMYPSRYIDEYIEKVDKNAQKMFKALGLRNGCIMLQGFYKNGEFYFYESGYRVGGEQMYILTDYLNNVNSLNCMLNYAMTGRMADFVIADRDNVHYRYPCCNYYVAMKPGVIDHIEGIKEIESMEGVLNITEICQPGHKVVECNALDNRIGFRLHVVGKTNEDLAKLLVKISQTLRIVSTEGYEMQLEPLTYDRCIDVINKK